METRRSGYEKERENKKGLKTKRQPCEEIGYLNIRRIIVFQNKQCFMARQSTHSSSFHEAGE